MNEKKSATTAQCNRRDFDQRSVWRLSDNELIRTAAKRHVVRASTWVRCAALTAVRLVNMRQPCAGGASRWLTTRWSRRHCTHWAAPLSVLCGAA